MQEEHRDNTLPGSVWLLILVCTSAVIIALAAGTAHTGISRARLSAAKASLGHIESVYVLADAAAADNSLRPEAGGAESLIRSYENDSSASAYEQYVLQVMLEAFGSGRDFDFAVSRFEDASGLHTSILYFPAKGRTNVRKDSYYLMLDGVLVESG